MNKQFNNKDISQNIIKDLNLLQDNNILFDFNTYEEKVKSLLYANNLINAVSLGNQKIIPVLMFNINTFNYLKECLGDGVYTIKSSFISSNGYYFIKSYIIVLSIIKKMSIINIKRRNISSEIINSESLLLIKISYFIYKYIQTNNIEYILSTLYYMNVYAQLYNLNIAELLSVYIEYKQYIDKSISNSQTTNTSSNEFYNLF